ncbi:MAG: hypothetical protein LBM12_00980 [Candidatus Nomurabacteria bacterium]|jgi:hypothetical protein|nr:hypothetical protein [Candidatus Nomurabacteria bacterium]
MDEQNQVVTGGLEQFINDLIGDKATGLTPEMQAEMHQSIATEINDAINRAVLAQLPDASLQEIEAHINDEPTALTELILKKAADANLDLDAIATDTLLQFRALYRGEVLADDLDKETATEATA